MKNKYFVFLILLFSCKMSVNQDNLKKKIDGMWDIYEMNYNHLDYKQELLINAFTVYSKDNKITIPETTNYENEIFDNASKWDIVGKDSLVINSLNVAFNGRYKINFFKDYDRKLLGMELKSKNTYIKAFKVMQDFYIDGKNW